MGDGAFNRYLGQAFILIVLTSSTKLISILLVKTSREFKSSGISIPGLGRLEVRISLESPNIDVRILAQGYCIAIVSLIKQETE